MRAAVLLALAAAPWLAAQTLDGPLHKEFHNIASYCGPAFSMHLLDRQADTNCGLAVLNGSPLHLVMQPFAPGNGTGFGLGYTREFTFGENWKNLFDAAGAGSSAGAWEGRLSVKLHPKFGKPPSLDEPPSKIKDKLEIQFYTRAAQLTQLDYYGPGPNSDRSALAHYSQRDLVAGLGVVTPVTWWFNVGGKVEGLWPKIGAAPDASVAPTYTHYEFFLRPHYPAADPYALLYKISYGFYQDHSTGRYSFRRFRADVLHNIYPERAGRAVRRDSILSFYGRLSLSDAAAGRTVPFYMQETLGGTDINGDPGLRGFPDYRFRAPYVLALEAEWNRRVWKPVGIMVFYDTGKVAMRKSDLGFSNLRHSVGAGLTFWSASRVVFRAYVGFGGGEGSHTFTGIMPLPGPVGTPYRSY